MQLCLEGMLRQTVSEFEVLVIDDASSDDTAAFLEGFREEKPSSGYPRGAPCRCRRDAEDRAGHLDPRSALLRSFRVHHADRH